MHIEKYIAVTANQPSEKDMSARFLEDRFATIVSKAIKRKGGRISNWNIDTSNSRKNEFTTMVWREDDSPFAEGKSLNKPEETALWLRKLADPIKKALTKEYKDVEVVLVTTSTEQEKL